MYVVFAVASEKVISSEATTSPGSDNAVQESSSRPNGSSLSDTSDSDSEESQGTVAVAKGHNTMPRCS